MSLKDLLEELKEIRRVLIVGFKLPPVEPEILIFEENAALRKQMKEQINIITSQEPEITSETIYIPADLERRPDPPALERRPDPPALERRPDPPALEEIDVHMYKPATKVCKKCDGRISFELYPTVLYPIHIDENNRKIGDGSCPKYNPNH